MAASPVRIAASLGDITWDAERSQAFVEGNLDAGTTYSVRSRVVVSTPQELDRVEFVLDPSFDARWTALPEDLDPRIHEIAERWTKGATSDYRKVLAIQERFQREDFTYSTAVLTGEDDASLVEFLTKTKTGFCVHYSSAMAVMVRTLGLPARIGVGFRAGTLQRTAPIW
jgi:transglutaminase-like putative cysteine protease